MYKHLHNVVQIADDPSRLYECRMHDYANRHATQSFVPREHLSLHVVPRHWSDCCRVVSRANKHGDRRFTESTTQHFLTNSQKSTTLSSGVLHGNMLTSMQTRHTHLIQGGHVGSTVLQGKVRRRRNGRHGSSNESHPYILNSQTGVVRGLSPSQS